jgi:very-short-patch-repair endonuclease
MAHGESVERARQFRRRPTRSEALLWQAIRGRALGAKFYRQKPVGNFIPDFVCESHRLIVEVDGGIHETQVEYDAYRQQMLEIRGYRLVRVSADEVERTMPAVLVRLRCELRDTAPTLDPRVLSAPLAKGGTRSGPTAG